MAGGPVLPARWLGGLFILVAAGIVGWQVATIMFRDTRLRTSRRARCGLALIIGPCVLGLIAVLAEITGLLYEWLLVGILAGVLGLTTLVWWRVRGRSPCEMVPLTHESPRAHGAEIAVWSVAVAVVAFTFVHVAMSPVIEWDAIVYHASVAKMWFLGRPHPALMYGPSVGIEISDNYPPLFPATGAFFYVALNRFDDFYLRIIPPIVLLGTLLLTYAYAAVRYSRSIARWAVVLMLGCPLLVMYGAWPTAYIYLTALTTAGIILIDFAIESVGVKMWLFAGLISGFACLTHFFGLIVVAIGVLSFFIFQRWRSRYDVKCIAVYLGSTLAVVGPWYLRNALLLGDPLYPLLSPPLHAKGLIQPIWNDSQAEIRNNAMGQWLRAPSAHVSLSLRFQELVTALFSHNLLPIGVLLAVIVGLWLARRGERRALFLVVSAGLLIGVQLVPGWYFLRALVPAMPVVAILSARGITLVRDATARAPSAHHRWFRPMKLGTVTLAALALVAASSGVAVAIIGPDNPSWATSLDSSQNLMQGVDDLGSTSATLNYVFQGSYQSWNWLNHHLADGGKVATLDVRNYYFTRPSELFYLDGIDGAPLLSLRSPTSIISYLRAHGVRYVYSPSWAVQRGPAQQPVERALPLMHLLGTKDFPLLADFAVGGFDLPDSIYAVGRSSSATGTSISPAVYLGPRGGAPLLPLGSRAYEISSKNTTPRLFVTPTSTNDELSFQYQAPDIGTFSMNEYSFASNTWSDGVFIAPHSRRSTWRSASIPLLGATPDRVVTFGIFASSPTVKLRDIAVKFITQPLLGAAGTVFPGSATIVVPPKGTSARLFLPTRSAVTSFYYRASGTEQVSFNAFDAQNHHWSDGVFSFTTLAHAGWRKVTLPTSLSVGGGTELGIYAPTSTVQIRDATSIAMNTTLVTSAHTAGSHVVTLPAGVTETELVPASTSGRGSVEFSITSSSSGTVQIAANAPSPGVPAISIPAVFTGSEERDLVLPVVTVAGDFEQYTVSATMPITISSATSRAAPLLLDSSFGISHSGAQSVATFLPQRTDSRLFLASAVNDHVRVWFQYETPSGGSVDINQYSAGQWRGVKTFGSTSGAWMNASFSATGSSVYSEFGLFAPTTGVELRNVTVSLSP
jgi:4-amino-4-deoxy-L-arabinose transferase-like glycosyltransferase